jgi:hypothetical protein
MRRDSRLRKFDPEKVGRYERDNYVAYYQRSWLRLLQASVGLVKETFGLSWPQAAYGAYLMARAEMAFAPFPENDLHAAIGYVERFYSFLKRVLNEDFDVGRTAKLEVNWWIVHRKLFGSSHNEELVQALQALYAEAYGVEPARFFDAARLRAQGMLCSDLWVNAGKPSGSPLLEEEARTLIESYRALKNALT